MEGRLSNTYDKKNILFQPLPFILYQQKAEGESCINVIFDDLLSHAIVYDIGNLV
jgi:hypothetical protein